MIKITSSHESLGYHWNLHIKDRDLEVELRLEDGTKIVFTGYDIERIMEVAEAVRKEQRRREEADEDYAHRLHNWLSFAIRGRK